MSNGDGQENRQEQGGVKSELMMSMNLENSGAEEQHRNNPFIVIPQSGLEPLERDTGQFRGLMETLWGPRRFTNVKSLLTG